MILAAVVILVGVFFVATGRGGEMAYEQADHAPLDLGPVSATDVALLRPPTALWGYNMQVTDEALDQIAQAVRDRDVTIAFLQQRLADLSAPPGPLTQPAPPAALTQPAALSPPAEPLARQPQPAEPLARQPQPAEPLARQPQPARPADAGDPPDDSALAAEEQTW